MSTPIILSLAALAIIILGVYFLSNKGKSSKKSKEQSELEIVEEVKVPPEFREEYNRGMHPQDYEDSTFFTLTRCAHCVRLERFLEAQEIPFTKILLDNFEGVARQQLMAVIRSYNERGSFPTLVSPDGDVAVGFREWQIRERFMKFSLLEEEKKHEHTQKHEQE